MNRYEQYFLKLGLENYRKSGNSYSEVQPRNTQELTDFINTANHLYENGWLTPHSYNIYADSISIVPNETLICYELTHEGLLKAKTSETT